MSGPIIRKYGFPNFEKIFGERKLEHGGTDEDEQGRSKARSPPGLNRPSSPRARSGPETDEEEPVRHPQRIPESPVRGRHGSGLPLFGEMGSGDRLLRLGGEALVEDLGESHSRLGEPLDGQREIGVLVLAAQPHAGAEELLASRGCDRPGGPPRGSRRPSPRRSPWSSRAPRAGGPDRSGHPPARARCGSRCEAGRNPRPGAGSCSRRERTGAGRCCRPRSRRSPTCIG